jgi:hypothetical protein
MISISGYDIRRYFDDNEIVGLAMSIHTNERNPKPQSQMRVAWLCRVYSRTRDGGFFRLFHFVLKALKEDQGPTL